MIQHMDSSRALQQRENSTQGPKERAIVTRVWVVCVCACARARGHSHEAPSFICACVHASISLVSSLAALVSAGLSIGQVDL